MSNIANIINTPVLLHGIGKGVFRTVSGKVLEVINGQSMKIDVTATTEDVYGGDGLFPLYTYISKKEGTVEIDSADFKLSQVAIAQGTENHTSGNKRIRRVLITKSATTLAGTTETLSGVEVIAMIAPDGSNQPVVASVPTGSDVDEDDYLVISSAGEITVGDNITLQDGEYAVWFKANETNAVSAEMLKNAMPEVASFNWMFVTEDSEGNRYQVDIYARRTRADGQLSIETGRDSASVPKLTVKILDPGDGHDDFAVITITKL